MEPTVLFCVLVWSRRCDVCKLYPSEFHSQSFFLRRSSVILHYSNMYPCIIIPYAEYLGLAREHASSWLPARGRGVVSCGTDATLRIRSGGMLRSSGKLDSMRRRIASDTSALNWAPQGALKGPQGTLKDFQGSHKDSQKDLQGSPGSER